MHGETASQQKSQSEIYAEIFNDPFCEEISWDALDKGRDITNAKTMTETDDKILFKPESKVLFLIPLLFLIASFFISLQVDDFSDNSDQAVWFVYALSCGAILFTSAILKPKLFDLSNEEYRFGWGKGKLNRVSFNDIHALQILAEYHRPDPDHSNSEPHYTYELNIVSRYGWRLNVIESKEKWMVVDQGHRIAQKIGKPIWNTVKMDAPSITEN